MSFDCCFCNLHWLCLSCGCRSPLSRQACSWLFSETSSEGFYASLFSGEWTQSLLTSYNSFSYPTCQGTSLGILCLCRKASWVGLSRYCKHRLKTSQSPQGNQTSLIHQILKVQFISTLPSGDSPADLSLSHLPRLQEPYISSSNNSLSQVSWALPTFRQSGSFYFFL